jgi:RNA methyltransferase, TrmH family
MITSPHNERVKLVRLLQSRSKARRQHNRLVLEGARLVADALDSGAQPDFLLCDAAGSQPGAPAADVVARAGAAGIACWQVADALMREMANTETPQGILGVFPLPDLPLPPAPGLVLVADGWRDPGNLGTVIRTAAAAGVDAVILTPGTVDPFNPKTLRAGMGGHFRVPVRALDWPGVVASMPELAIYLADAAGDTPYTAVDWARPALLVVGGEAHGFSRAAANVPHTRIRIPMMPGAESLNAAVSASILIYEARRHRFF